MNDVAVFGFLVCVVFTMSYLAYAFEHWITKRYCRRYGHEWLWFADHLKCRWCGLDAHSKWGERG